MKGLFVRAVPGWKESIAMILQNWCEGNYGLYFPAIGSLNTGKKIGFV